MTPLAPRPSLPSSRWQVRRGALLLCALLTTCGWAPPGAAADTLEAMFSRANEAYYAGDFAHALEGYEALVAAGVRDPDVYFNQGIAQARQGHLGHAILAFERAAKLAPGNADIDKALGQARDAVGRRLANREGEATVRTRPPLRVALFRSWSESALGWLLLLANAAFFGCLIGRLFLTAERVQLGLAVGAVCAGLCALTAGFGLATQVGLGQAGEPAVVVGRDASLREGPSAGAQARVQAPEGALAWVLQRDADWARVRLQGGGQGWLPAVAVGTLAPQ